VPARVLDRKDQRLLTKSIEELEIEFIEDLTLKSAD
jgi:hypothetical protein